MKRRIFAALCLASAAVLSVSVSVPASAETTHTVDVVNLSNKVANPKTIAVDSKTGKVYVGEANGTSGAQVTVLDPKEKKKPTVIRVGDPYDPSKEWADSDQIPVFQPSSVISLIHNADARTLVALVSDNHTIGPAYSHLNGSFVVLINTNTNKVTKRYRVSSGRAFNGETFALRETVWTGMALDAKTNTLYGVADYDPLVSNRLYKLNLATGALVFTDLAMPDGSYPFPPPAGVTFNRFNNRVYVSQDRHLYSFDSALRRVTRLPLPLAPGQCEADNAPSGAPSFTTASPASNTVYVNDCGYITAVNGATNTVIHSMGTTGIGLALDAGAQRVYTLTDPYSYGAPKIAIYSTAKRKLITTVPVALGSGGLRNGNAWFAVNTTNHKIYLPSSASTISVLVPHA